MALFLKVLLLQVYFISFGSNVSKNQNLIKYKISDHYSIYA